MTALHDSDGDDYADVEDDDLDGDGCDNDVDNHPNERWVPIGTRIHPNCTPSKTTWLGDESLHSDDDGIPDCEDDDDDNDDVDDVDDPCPTDPDDACWTFGQTCPWNPQFFDCRVFGCGELLLKFMSLINPDPTRDLFFRILSVDERVVTVAPPEGLSLEQGARVLAAGPPKATRAIRAAPGRTVLRRKTGAETRTPPSAPERRLFGLEVVGPYGRFGGENIGGFVAAFEPGRVRVGSLRDANALELRFDKGGRGLEIVGVKVDLER